MIRTALTTLVLIASLGAGQAFAAVNSDGVEIDTAKQECEFVAELGGYRCEMPAQHASLSEPNDPNGKKKLKLQFIPNFIFP